MKLVPSQKLLFKSLLDVYYDDRANLQDILNTALNISKQPMMIDIKMINNFASQDNALKEEELSSIIWEFVRFSDLVLRKKILTLEEKENCKVKIKDNLMKFKNEYLKAYSSYFDSGIYAQSNLLDGIAVFFTRFS